ncbi:unnamed protein product [Prorocentrum cordatum]|uniref:Uncharacterized protein n=1 Tax=Prorocentrum cordatum TaxID=2364126 RepID=A0ABN9WQP1_9DINO|nr:unnamed protein product [Polarella glacialis]
MQAAPWSSLLGGLALLLAALGLGRARGVQLVDAELLGGDWELEGDLALQTESGVGCYVRLEDQQCVVRALGEKYRRWTAVQKGRDSLAACQGLAHSLDHICQLEPGTVQVSFGEGPPAEAELGAAPSAALERARGLEAAAAEGAAVHLRHGLEAAEAAAGAAGGSAEGGNCLNTAGLAKTKRGHGCVMFQLHPGTCTYAYYYDDADFTAGDMCCACGGGRPGEGRRPEAAAR